MTLRRNYFICNNYSLNHPRRILLLILMYISVGIQANVIFRVWGYYLYINLLLVLAGFLTIEYPWKHVKWYCFCIGLLLDAFSLQGFGASACAIWGVCFMLSRVKRTFYIEYISTIIFLLFVLIIGYCFIYTLWHYLFYTTGELIAPFTLMVIQNSPLTLLCVPVLYPLLRIFLNVKK